MKALGKITTTSALMFAAGLAQAASLDFGVIAPTAGTIQTQPAGASTVLVGSGIDVDNLIGLGTSLHDNVATDCDACSLDFTTGSLVSYDAGTMTWSFSGGGSIAITGGLDFTDNSSIADITTGATLLTGTFTEATVVEVSAGTFEFSILGAAFEDVKHPDIVAYYGFAPGTAFEGGLNISFAISALGVDPQGNFSSAMIYSGDVVNTPVPVPAAVWMFSSALLGLTAVGRTRGVTA